KTSETNSVTIDGDGSETIDGGATYVFTSGGVYVISDGANWRVLSEDRVLPGMSMAWLTSTVPGGWLECDGAAVSRTTYSRLFGRISDDYGPGDGSTTFNLPDLRGEFLRGWDHGEGNDPNAASRTDRGDGTTGDNVGTKQADAFKSHTHNFKTNGQYAPDSSGLQGGTLTMVADGNEGFGTGTIANNIANAGGNETRPR